MHIERMIIMNNTIIKENKQDLADFLHANFPVASDEEEAEINKILETLDLDETGEELKIEDLLEPVKFFL